MHPNVPYFAILLCLQKLPRWELIKQQQNFFVRQSKIIKYRSSGHIATYSWLHMNFPWTLQTSFQTLWPSSKVHSHIHKLVSNAFDWLFFVQGPIRSFVYKPLVNNNLNFAKGLMFRALSITIQVILHIRDSVNFQFHLYFSVRDNKIPQTWLCTVFDTTCIQNTSTC